MTTTARTISKTAQTYFLHAHDENHDTGELCCYFSQNGEENGWGVWIDKHGKVDIDETSANGETPSTRLLEIIKIAARKKLS
jgi:hypothetical protein